MTHYGRRGVIVLLLVMLAMPAGVAFADQVDQEQGFPVLGGLEQVVLRLWNRIAEMGAQAEPSGKPQEVDGQVPSERSDARQKAGAQLEPNG